MTSFTAAAPHASIFEPAPNKWGFNPLRDGIGDIIRADESARRKAVEARELARAYARDDLEMAKKRQARKDKIVVLRAIGVIATMITGGAASVYSWTLPTTNFDLAKTMVDFTQPDDAQAMQIKTRLLSDENRFTREDRALEAIREMYVSSPATVVSYFNDKAGQIISARLANPDADVTAIEDEVIAAYAQYRPSAGYKIWDDAGRNRFLDLIETDYTMQNARKLWYEPEGQDLQFRKDAVQALINLHALAYSDGAFRVEAPTLVLREIDSPVTMAYYTVEDDRPIIAMRPGDLLKWDFAQVMDTATHEEGHNDQNHLMYALHSGLEDYLVENAIKSDAQIFEIASSTLRVQYMDDKGAVLKGYINNPMEVDARFASSDGGFAGVGKMLEWEIQSLDGPFERVDGMKDMFAKLSMNLNLRPAYSAEQQWIVVPQLRPGF